MKLQRTTLILLLLALGLGGFVYFYERVATPQQEAAKVQAKKIFAFKKEEIQTLTIKNNTEALKFERVNPPAGTQTRLSSWQMIEPLNTPASEPAISYLLDLLVQGKSDRTFNILESQRSDYGLDQPFSTVEITLKNQRTHRIILGKPDFDRKFLYAQIDSAANKPQTLEVALVPIDFEYGVKRPLSEWQAKEESSNKPSPKELTTPQTASPLPSPQIPPKKSSQQTVPQKSAPPSSTPSP